MSTLTANHVIALLTDYTKQTGATIDVLLVGALALQAYGYQDRLTRDVDAEVVGSVEALARFFSQHQLPADLTENFSGWSIVAMSPGYRERATDLVHQAQLRVKLLAPVDFIIAKLRRGTDLDLDDASFVSTRFGITKIIFGMQSRRLSLPLHKIPRSFFFGRQWTSFAKVFHLSNHNHCVQSRY